MSELAEQRLREWRSRAIRELLELERRAKHLRNQLEEDPDLRLSDLSYPATILHGHALTFVTYVDKSTVLAEVGL